MVNYELYSMYVITGPHNPPSVLRSWSGLRNRTWGARKAYLIVLGKTLATARDWRLPPSCKWEPSFIWDVIQRKLAVTNRRFGTNDRSNLLEPVKMWPISCPETSVTNYIYTLRNIPEERKSQMLGRLCKYWSYVKLQLTLYSHVLCRAHSEPDDTRWRTGGEVKGKLENGVGSQYSHATSERGLSGITQDDAHTSAASSRLNWRPPPI